MNNGGTLAPPPAPLHVFYVHSHLTAAVALGVIKRLGLAYAQCAVVFDRGYSRELPAGLQSAALLPVRLALKTAPWRLWGQIRAFDKRVTDLTRGQPFHLYVPHLDLDPARLLFTNPKCVGVSFIEEGLMSYVNTESSRGWDLKLSLLKRAATFGRAPNLPPFPPLHHRAYGLNEKVFPALGEKVVLAYPFDTFAEKAQYQLDGAFIIVFDALIEMSIVQSAAFEAGMRTLAAYLRDQRATTVYYKLHPVQLKSAERAAYYADLLQRLLPGVTCQPLPGHLSLEEVAGAYTGLTFCIAISSVGFYAALAGQRVVSFAREIARHDAAFGRTVEKIVSVYGDQMLIL